jgi:hypothetical protein
VICVCFGTNERWTSRLIRWATDAEYSHTWGEYPDVVWRGTWAAHSSKKGVVKIPAERVHEEYPKHIVYECKVDLSKGIDWARDRFGADYDYGVIWNALLLVIYRYTQWKWLEKIVARCETKLSCSEFWTGLLKNAGTVAGMEDMDPELTTSGALRQFMRYSDDFELIGRSG